MCLSMYKYCDFQSVTKLLYSGLIKSTIKSYNVMMSDLFGAYNAAERKQAFTSSELSRLGNGIMRTEPLKYLFEDEDDYDDDLNDDDLIADDEEFALDPDAFTEDDDDEDTDESNSSDKIE